MKRWLLGLSVLMAALVFVACGDVTPEIEDGDVLIYYVDHTAESRGGDAIRGVPVDLGLAEDAPWTEKAVAVVREMMETPAVAGLQSPLPQSAELLGVELQGRRALVDFSTGFNRLSGVELSLANSCLALSLAQLDAVSAVTVTVQGRPVARQQVFFERNVLLSSMDDVLQTVDATMYFFDENGKLTPEERVLEVYEGQLVAENLVLELLEGPESRSLLSLLPDGFQVNSVRLESGVCYVNLPRESLNLLPEDEQQQRAMLLGLAQSLYSLEMVEQLRLVTDGVELEYFGSAPVDFVSVRNLE